MIEKAKDNFTILKDADKIILNELCDTRTLEQVDEIVKNTSDTRYAYDNVDKYFSKLTWNRQEKRNSPTIGILLKHKDEIEAIGMNINTAFITIIAMIFYNGNSKWFALPDRFLVMRNQTSRWKLYDFIYILDKTRLIETKKQGATIYVKLNCDIFKKDPLILKSFDRYRKASTKALIACERIGSDFYYRLSTRVVLDNINRTIIGIIIYYNLMFNPELGQRGDIMYMEVPVHIIKEITKLSVNDIMSRVNQLCEHTKYIAKHDKVYVSTRTVDNYYNTAYRQENPLVDAKEAELPEEHPIITDFSVIIFNDVFKESGMYKKIKRNAKLYKELIIREVRHLKLDNYEYNDVYNAEEVVKQKLDEICAPSLIDADYINKDMKQAAYDFAFEVDDEGNKTVTADIISVSKLNQKIQSKKKPKPRLKLYENINVYQCANLLKSIVKRTTEEDCSNGDLNYYIRLLNQATEVFWKLVDKLKSNVEHYNKFRNRWLQDETLLSIVGS